MSYDSQELLRVFAARKGLKYPLLADLDSRIIRNFGILNDNFPPGHALHGVPFPGTYIIDERGIVQAKFFEEDHRERFTAGSVLVRQFQTSGGIEKTTVATPHLKLSFSAADADLSPGGRTTLVLEVELAPGMHVYAPGVEGGYIPIDWKMPESKAWLAHPALYPPAKSVHLEAIQETALVYAGRFRVMRDLTIGQGREIASLVGPDRKLVVDGTFRYQACDDRQCFPPRSVPLNWTFRIEELDTQRAPVELRRR